MNGMAAVLVFFCSVIPPPSRGGGCGQGKEGRRKQRDSGRVKLVASPLNGLLMGVRAKGACEIPGAQVYIH